MKHKRKNKKSHIAIRFLAMLIVGLALLFTGSQLYLANAGKPVDVNVSDPVPVEIPSGSSTDKIAEILSENNLIKSTFAFGIKSRISGYDGKYKAGYYELSADMSMEDIMAEIMKGTALTVRFTIPEGFDIRRTVERLSEDGLVNKDEFFKQIEEGAYSYEFLNGAPAGQSRLEGFLYPDTYEIYPDSTEAQIIEKMLNRFDQLFLPEYYEKAEEMGLSVSQVITMASIIEREAKVAADRPIIASVFYNRLKAGMPLQSCATVQYILGEQKEKLTNKDIAIDSPYNTYKIAGLPPGPICSPGIESIKAALYPAETNYLYFLAKGDGSHVFSETYEDFLKNKALYID